MIDGRLDVMYKEVGDMIGDIEYLNTSVDDLNNSLSNMMGYIDHLNTRVNDLNNYIKFINIDESISYDEWFKVRNDAEELIKLKRNITINEIIK